MQIAWIICDNAGNESKCPGEVKMKRVHVYIRGIVQGVFFRAATKKAASGLNITGWVRNMEDGRVEAVLEGEDDDVEKMIAWCRVGPRSAQVTNVNITPEHYTGSFRDFSIKYM